MLYWCARLDLHKLVHSNVVVVVSSKQPEEGTDVNEKKVECKEISGIVNRNRYAKQKTATKRDGDES